MEEKDQYTTREVADLLNLSEYTVRKKIRDQEINAKGSSGRNGYRIDKEEVIKYANKHKISLLPMAAMAATVMSPVLGISLGAIASLGGFLSSVFTSVDNKKVDDDKKIELYDMAIERIKKDIDGLKMKIEALQLEADDSIKCKKDILHLKMLINEKEGNIQEIEIQKKLIGIKQK